MFSDKKFLLEIATRIAKASERCPDKNTKKELQEIVRSVLQEAETRTG